MILLKGKYYVLFQISFCQPLRAFPGKIAKQKYLLRKKMKFSMSGQMLTQGESLAREQKICFYP